VESSTKRDNRKKKKGSLGDERGKFGIGGKRKRRVIRPYQKGGAAPRGTVGLKKIKQKGRETWGVSTVFI